MGLRVQFTADVETSVREHGLPPLGSSRFSHADAGSAAAAGAAHRDPVLLGRQKGPAGVIGGPAFRVLSLYVVHANLPLPWVALGACFYSYA